MQLSPLLVAALIKTPPALHKVEQKKTFSYCLVCIVKRIKEKIIRSTADSTWQRTTYYMQRAKEEEDNLLNLVPCRPEIDQKQQQGEQQQRARDGNKAAQQVKWVRT